MRGEERVRWERCVEEGCEEGVQERGALGRGALGEALNKSYRFEHSGHAEGREYKRR